MQKNDSKISVSVVAMFIVILLIVAMAFLTNADSVCSSVSLPVRCSTRVIISREH